MPPRAPNVLIGIGNLLRRDDGVGVIVAQHMARLPLPDHVEVIDAGTAGTELAALLEHRRLAVVVDAIDAGQPPGSVYRLDPDSLQPASHSGLSVHDLHFLHALAETRLLGTAPQRVVILAVQVADTATGIGLSPPVAHAANRVLALVAEELGLSPQHVQPPPARHPGLAPERRPAGAVFTEVIPWQ
jgi:hydrogenase maturation protease